MAIHVCTIIARNYLASARVLFESLVDSNPKSTFSVLIIDDKSGAIVSGADGFEVIHLGDIGIDEFELAEMTAIYNVTELATAVKPWLMHTLIDRWSEPVIYLDPDIMVFRPLDRVDELARAHQMVITPHSSVPIPRDHKRISESEILAAGIYNLGFIAVGVEGIPFLEFWKVRLRRECISAPESMRFVDQRWVDFAPAMFDAYILKEPTYNVAYWNLHGRRFSVDRASGRFLVDGQEIHFFHFSGYNPLVPELLSKYQGGEARILFSDQPDLKTICDLYGTKLLEADYVQCLKQDYAYKMLDNGIEYDGVMRRVYREALFVAEEEDGPQPPNPFVSADAFLLWLNSPSEDGFVSRYLELLYNIREDLQRVFPNAEGSGLPNLLAWAWGEASKGKFERRLIPSGVQEEVDPHDARPEPVSGSRFGIQIAGHFRAEMGVGELGRNTVKAVAASGIPFSTYTDTDVVHRQNFEFEESSEIPHAVNIVNMNADAMVHFAYRMGSEYFKDRYTIGVWAWELEEFPDEFDESFQFVDEIWACSEFTRDAIAAKGLKPVYKLPVTVEMAAVDEVFDRAKFDIPDGFVFLFCFDLLSIFERKNPLALIEAFTSAFAPNEGPTLVIKALNGDKRLADLEKIKIMARGRSDIVVLTKYLDYADNIGLFKAADCYVSLHRSEGLGLTIAEAMSLGKPVIATAYSGNMDFMDEHNSFLIPFTYSSVPKNCEPYRMGARWADPDIGEAAKKMRFVFENQETAAKVGERAGRDMREKHSARLASKFIIERYEHALDALHIDPARDSVKADPAPPRTAGEPDAPGAVVASGVPAPADQAAGPPPLIAMAARPSLYDGASRFRALVRTARRLLRRLLVVRDSQQREMDLALAAGVEHLARLWSDMHSQLQQFETFERQVQQRQSAFEVKLDTLNRINSDLVGTIESVRREVASAKRVPNNER